MNLPYPITFVTYIYPQVEKYLENFIFALNSQTFLKFNILIFNDGVIDCDQYFSHLKVPFQIIDVKGSPNEIRHSSLEEIKKQESDFIIFQDADDLPELNRVEEIYNKSMYFDLIVNDLNIIDESGKLIEKSIWSKRIDHGFIFDRDFIKTKNIIGLGNTAIRRSILQDTEIKFSKKPLAYDWFLFYQLMAENNPKAVFISSTCTNYRQHDENIAGIKQLDSTRLKYVIEVKTKHYKSLNEVGYDMNRELEDLNKKGSSVFNKINKLNFNPLWWEETELT